jgi:hypothetical protein
MGEKVSLRRPQGERVSLASSIPLEGERNEFSQSHYIGLTEGKSMVILDGWFWITVFLDDFFMRYNSR